MSCLNEQLAVKVMGMEWKQVYWYKDGEVAYYHHNAVDCSKPGLEHWNPIEDLNQLDKCYFELSEANRKFVWLHVVHLSWEQETPELLDIFENKSLYAQAILKAKEEK